MTDSELINYFAFSRQMKELKKAVDAEESRLKEEEKRQKEELDKRLAVLNRQRKFLRKRRTLLKYEVENVRLGAEDARREAAAGQWTAEDRGAWEDAKLGWAEDTFWLREAGIEKLEQIAKEWATVIKTSNQRWSLESEADKALELVIMQE